MTFVVFVFQEFVSLLDVDSLGKPLSDCRTRKGSKRFTIENVRDGAHPALSQTPKDEVERRIRDANNVWHKNYNGFDHHSSSDATSKHATFSPSDQWETIYEDPDLSEDLRISRTSDTARRRADHERMERLLAPVFDPTHREKMWKLIQPESC